MISANSNFVLDPTDFKPSSTLPRTVLDSSTGFITTPRLHATAEATVSELETRTWLTTVDRATPTETNTGIMITKEGTICIHTY